MSNEFDMQVICRWDYSSYILNILIRTSRYKFLIAMIIEKPQGRYSGVKYLTEAIVTL